MTDRSFVQRVRDKLLYDIAGHVPTSRPFIFGIGLSKTGTTSLNDALEILGFKAKHLPPIARAENGRIKSDWPWWVYQYDALTDLTVAVLYKELRETFPHARFIYTRRPIEPWLASCKKHFTAELSARRRVDGQAYLNPLVEAVYGAETYNEPGFRTAYARHDSKVMDAFAGRSNFMSYDLTEGAGWQPLCEFLDLPTPDLPFPVSNKASKPLRPEEREHVV